MLRTSRSKQRMNWSAVTKPVLCAVGVTYLCFHVLHGERGIYALFREMHRSNALQEQLAQKITERTQLETKVSHLRDGALDLDLLDEQMRRMQGYSSKDELLILLNPQ